MEKRIKQTQLELEAVNNKLNKMSYSCNEREYDSLHSLKGLLIDRLDLLNSCIK